MQLLAQGGIPVTSIVKGGKIAFVKIEHVWVEMWVDFYPSRGAINKVGDSWVPIDASFKQYQILILHLTLHSAKYSREEFTAVNRPNLR